jgi:hypothetical protein
VTNYPDESEHYRLALDTEPGLVAIETVVDLICDQGLPSQMAWSSVVETLALPFIGNMRGIGIDNAKNPKKPDLDADERLEHLLESMEDMSAKDERLEKYRLPAETATEEWMRTSEAWDAVTEVWIRKMQEADPARKIS